ncbi:hypothetical protein Bbelb_177410 [Branchiostoma belcheri]|nr:hypothetical protein Bbelb_177410 [Branchiostoma belcheri]
MRPGYPSYPPRYRSSSAVFSCMFELQPEMFGEAGLQFSRNFADEAVARPCPVPWRTRGSSYTGYRRVQTAPARGLRCFRGFCGHSWAEPGSGAVSTLPDTAPETGKGLSLQDLYIEANSLSTVSLCQDISRAGLPIRPESRAYLIQTRAELTIYPYHQLYERGDIRCGH